MSIFIVTHDENSATPYKIHMDREKAEQLTAELEKCMQGWNYPMLDTIVTDIEAVLSITRKETPS